MRVVALIPAYNEEARIGATLQAVGEIGQVDEVVVIDDGSKDNTSTLAERYAATSDKVVTVLRLDKNQGKGAALNFGLAQVPGEVYLLLDADLGETASLAEALLGPILAREAEMTIARFAEEQSLSKRKMGFGLVRRLAVFGVQLLTGKQVSSPLSGQRAVRAEVLAKLGKFAPGFGVEVGLTVGALHHGFNIVEVPLAMKHRAYGRGLVGFKHRGKQLLHVLKTLWSCWQRGWHL